MLEDMRVNTLSRYKSNCGERVREDGRPRTKKKVIFRYY
jgi:hypothetical protein